MKKLLFSIAIVAAGLLVASCGKKVLEGETLNTRFYTLIVPTGWKYTGTNIDKGLQLKKLNEDGRTTEKGLINFNVVPYSKIAKLHEPAEMRDYAVEKRGEVNKGDLQYGGVTYYASYSEEFDRYRLRTKLAEDAVLEVEIKDMDFENPMIKEILDNVVIKETPDALSMNYDCEYFSVTTPDGWTPDPGSSKLRMTKDDVNITVSTSTIPFEKLKENWKSCEPRGEMTVGDITWSVFVNERSKLYNLATDIASEPNKALYITTFKVLPDDPELKKVLETVKLKK